MAQQIESGGVSTQPIDSKPVRLSNAQPSNKEIVAIINKVAQTHILVKTKKGKKVSDAQMGNVARTAFPNPLNLMMTLEKLTLSDKTKEHILLSAIYDSKLTPHYEFEYQLNTASMPETLILDGNLDVFEDSYVGYILQKHFASPNEFRRFAKSYNPKTMFI
ncbi:MAG: hypothetical protein P0S95_05500 [Rhabdochlamydiaceae bacterium]|nr:hypothetical protein [Candidatus Amphrikana amoebophyrae]